MPYPGRHERGPLNKREPGQEQTKHDLQGMAYTRWIDLARPQNPIFIKSSQSRGTGKPHAKISLLHMRTGDILSLPDRLGHLSPSWRIEPAKAFSLSPAARRCRTSWGGWTAPGGLNTH